MKRVFIILLSLLLFSCSNQTTCEPVECIEKQEEPSLESQIQDHVYDDLLIQKFFLDFIQATMSGYYQTHGQAGFNILPNIEVTEDNIATIEIASLHDCLVYDGVEYLISITLDYNTKEYSYRYNAYRSFEYQNYDGDRFMAYFRQTRDENGNYTNTLVCRGGQIFTPIDVNRDNYKLVDENNIVYDFFNDLQQSGYSVLSTLIWENQQFEVNLENYLNEYMKNI